MKYYLAGRMTGLPDFNYPEFERVAKELRNRGLEIVSPHELHVGESKATRGLQPYQQYLVAGIVALTRCDAIILMEGWAQSTGARKELDVALTLNLKIFYWSDEHLIEIS